MFESLTKLQRKLFVKYVLRYILKFWDRVEYQVSILFSSKVNCSIKAETM